jgi:flagellar assembly protein FliH
MLKAVFRPGELVNSNNKVIIDSPTSYQEHSNIAPAEDKTEETGNVEVYTGPTAEDLRREAELFKFSWESEKEKMISAAKMEAERIIREANNTALSEAKIKNDDAAALKQQAEQEAARIVQEAKTKAAEIEKEIRQTLETERKDAQDKGREDGYEKGYAQGKAEVDRLIERTQVVLERAQDKRAEILSESEQEIVNLVLLIARKVVKILSENQRNVVISNVVQALRKVKSRGEVIIKVNMNDLKITTEHKQEFINMLEGVKTIHVVEDNCVDSGGCIIETDFGEIDARIFSQLAELENKILEISPIKSNADLHPPVSAIKTAGLNTELAAASTLMDTEESISSGEAEETPELSAGVNAALTASAALAAIATMATKGKRESDKKLAGQLENVGKRITDQQT